MVEFVKAKPEQLKNFTLSGGVEVESIDGTRAVTLKDAYGKQIKFATDGSYTNLEVYIEKPKEKKIKYEIIGKLLGGMIEYKEIVNEEYDANKLKNEIESKDSLADIKINKIEVME
jgi:hypothetical protein